VEAHISAEEQRYFIVDDTGIPKKGTHSVGVSHQYGGQLGKQANCQVAVSVSLASEKASVPVAWQLYLSKSWSQGRDRCDVVGVPKDLGFSTKSHIALLQLQQCHERGIPHGIVLADAAYGNDHSFWEGLEASGLFYLVGTKSNTSV
jgi:SRSO17 transposase